MNEALFQLISYFFIYSFLGWCMEIAYAALKKKHFYNRGVLNGPLCPVYGIGMILILTFFSSLRESLVFLAIGRSGGGTIPIINTIWAVTSVSHFQPFGAWERRLLSVLFIH